MGMDYQAVGEPVLEGLEAQGRQVRAAPAETMAEVFARTAAMMALLDVNRELVTRHQELARDVLASLRKP